MNYFHTTLFASLACFSFAIIPLTAKKPDRAVESIDGSVYEVGTCPKDLYKKLGFIILGPRTTEYAKKLYRERIEDNEGVHFLGRNEHEQIENLKWSTCLMIRRQPS